MLPVMPIKHCEPTIEKELPLKVTAVHKVSRVNGNSINRENYKPFKKYLEEAKNISQGTSEKESKVDVFS